MAWSSPIVAVDIAAESGFRSHMEDATTALPDLSRALSVVPLKKESIFLPSGPIAEVSCSNLSYFGVFDGHGGDSAAYFLQAKFHSLLAAHPELHSNPPRALIDTFALADRTFLNSKECVSDRVGATAVVAIISENHIHVAWLGDSEALLFRKGDVNSRHPKNQKLTSPHRPLRADEHQRIACHSGHVARSRDCKRVRSSQSPKLVGRVNGILAVSRAIGDQCLKQWVTCEAETVKVEIDNSLNYLVLASDGLWDVMSPAQVDREVKEHLKQQLKFTYPVPSALAKGAAQRLVKCAMRRRGTDNISVILIFFSGCQFFQSPSSNVLSCASDATPSKVQGSGGTEPRLLTGVGAGSSRKRQAPKQQHSDENFVGRGGSSPTGTSAGRRFLHAAAKTASKSFRQVFSSSRTDSD